MFPSTTALKKVYFKFYRLQKDMIVICSYYQKLPIHKFTPEMDSVETQLVRCMLTPGGRTRKTRHLHTFQHTIQKSKKHTKSFFYRCFIGCDGRSLARVYVICNTVECLFEICQSAAEPFRASSPRVARLSLLYRNDATHHARV